MMWGIYGGEWWWMLIGSFWMIVFWGVVIWLVVWGVRQVTGTQREGHPTTETPLEIAQKRLARGEITREEFEEIQSALR